MFFKQKEELHKRIKMLSPRYQDVGFLRYFKSRVSLWKKITDFEEFWCNGVDNKSYVFDARGLKKSVAVNTVEQKRGGLEAKPQSPEANGDQEAKLLTLDDFHDYLKY